MKLLSVILFVITAMHASQAQARDENRRGFACVSDTGITLEATLPDSFYHSFIFTLARGNKHEELSWGHGAEPGQPSYGNADFNFIESKTDGVFTLYVQKLTGTGGDVRFFAIPSTYKDLGDYKVSFQAKADLLLFDNGFTDAKVLFSCEGQL
jgi:hypothetical protein